MKISTKLLPILENLKGTTVDNAIIVGGLYNLADPKVDYLDYTYIDGKIKFTVLPLNAYDSNKNAYENASRQNVTFGRLITKSVDENARRKFIELVTAKIKTEYVPIEIEVVSGEDIRWTYDRDNYLPIGSGGNILSCMAHPELYQQLDFYVYNPETVAMARAMQGDKVVGRALLVTAYETLELLKSGVGAKKLLTRYYVQRASITSLYDDWARKNVDFRISGQLSFDKDNNQFECKKWYIPLKHWDLNYYPYMDHFNTVLKNAADGVGVWTNDLNIEKQYKWIHPGKDSYVDSEGRHEAKPDPFRPNEVWMKNTKLWMNIDTVTKVRGQWYPKTDVATCDVCSEAEVRNKLTQLIHDKKACKNHTLVSLRTGLHALKDEATRCIACNQWNLKEDCKENVCITCKDRMVDCPSCELPIDKNFLMTVVTGEQLCPKCIIDKNYALCDMCHKLCIKPSYIGSSWTCSGCYTVSIETAEKEVEASPDIPYGNPYGNGVSISYTSASGGTTSAIHGTYGSSTSATNEHYVETDFIDVSENAINISIS